MNMNIQTKFLVGVILLMWGQFSFAESFTLKSVIVENISPLITPVPPDYTQPYYLVQVRDAATAAPPAYDSSYYPDVAALKSTGGAAQDCSVPGPDSLNYNIRLTTDEPDYRRGKAAWEAYLRVLKVARDTQVPVTLGYLEIPVGTISGASITVDCGDVPTSVIRLPRVYGIDVVGGVEIN